MKREKKELKYYRIRADIVWAAAICMAVLMVIGFYRKCGDDKERAPGQENHQKTINVTFEGMKTDLDDAKQCYLCGKSERSLMGYYRKFDTVGLISLNDWYVLDFPLKNYDSEGDEVIGRGSDNSTYGNTGEIAYSRSGIAARGKAGIDVTLPEDYKLNTDILRENLCQECLDKVAASLEYWKWEDEEKEAIPLCLVDFDTLEIYPVQNRYTGYFIRDYWIEIDCDENEIEVDAFYLPEQKER